MSDQPPPAPDAPPAQPAADWRASLPDTLKADPSLATIPDIPTLAQVFVDTKRAFGAEKMLKPQKTWGDKEWNEHYTALGRPETADKYAMPDVKLDESVPLDDAAIKGAREHFHKLGLTNDQAKGILEFYFGNLNNQVKGMRESSARAVQEAKAALKKEWGDKYDFNAGVARSALNKFGDPDILNHFDQSTLGNNPQLVKFLANVGAAMLEDSATGKGKSAGGSDDKLAAQAQIEKLKWDKEFQAKRSIDPAANAEWMRLHAVAYPQIPQT